MKATFVPILVLAMLAGSVRAQFPSPFTAVTPQQLNYQGRLTTPAGAPYTNAVYDIEFRVWPAASGGATPLWGARYSVYAKEGYFNVILGAPGGVALACTYSNEIWKALWFNPSSPQNKLYLGIKVLNDVAGNALPAAETQEAFPRQQLLCSPFAERAQMAQYARESIDDFFVRQKLTVSGLLDANLGLDVSGGSILLAGNLTHSVGTATFNNGIVINTVVADLNKGLDVDGGKTYLRAGAEVSGLAELKGGAEVTGNLGVTATVTATNINATAKIKEGGNALIPKGVIVMWTGTTAPAGWALCDGNNGTPNLKGRFIVGYDPGDTDYNAVNVSPGKTGGEKTHTLSVPEMPSHSHTWLHGTEQDDSGSGGSNREYTQAGGSDSGVIQATGGGGAHENRPPYYTLAYIMKL
jgi:microcystin-dependent protein